MKKGIVLIFLLSFTAICNVACGKGMDESVPIIEEVGDGVDEPSLIIEEADDGVGYATFDGIKHSFILDLPAKTEGAPLAIMLHGYGGNAEAFRRDVGFEKDANPRGYAVVYVTGAANKADSTSATGWNSGTGDSDNEDVGFLVALTDELCDKYSFDRNRIFAIGFSNGAFMTHRLALEANDTFAAVVSVAGMMPQSIWDNKPYECNIGILQITGQKDDVVPKNSDGSAKYAKAPAIEDVMYYYVKGNGLTDTESVPLGKKAVLNKYSSDTSSKQVWDIFIKDGRHSWPDEKIVGFNTNNIILDFLETQ